MWLYGGGINVCDGQNVEIRDNVIRGNRAGITAVDICRSETTGLKNVYIHDNDIETAGEWAAGFATTCGRPIWNSDNRYERNRYKVASSTKFCGEDQDHLGWQEWQALGQDAGGTYEVV